MTATIAEWRVSITHPAEPTPVCAPTVLSRRQADQLEYLAACRGCDWTSSETTGDANQAVEDAHDHTHPGYRHLPAVELASGWRHESTAKRLDVIRAALARVYPAGWIEAGHAPMWTYRTPPASRHVPAGSLFGGYDLARPALTTERAPVLIGAQGVLFA